MLKPRIVPFLCLLALAAAACGEPAPTVDLARAATLATEEGSARAFMSVTQELPGSAGGGELTMEGEGILDLARQRGEFKLSASGEGGQAANTAETMGDLEMVTTGFVVYMRYPFLTQQLPGDAEWIKIDIERASEEMGIDLGQLLQAGQQNPSQGLDYLRGATDVQEVGTEVVRGVETTHYKGNVDLDKLKEELPDAASSLDKLTELTGIGSIPSEAWVDADGLPRRVHYEFDYDPPADAPAGTPTGKMEMTMEFFDFGVEADITPPPKSDVIDILQMLKQQTGGAN